MNLEKMKKSLESLLTNDVIQGMTEEQKEQINKALNTKIDVENIDARIQELHNIGKHGIKN